MSAVWTHLRRFIASLVLVAMAVFVLHNGAMAGMQAHGLDSVRSGTQAAIAKELQQHPGCGGETAGVEVEDGCALMGADHDHDGAQGLHNPHCGSVCGFALPSVNLGLATVRVVAMITLTPESQQGSGIDPNGLKRPPRTPHAA
ncbi:hypothetical protein [Microvirga splendida]|uniref:DUF2946 domain-containing protein n=1 Tax=Microvirga splendida TaxID=2795727 RepID=A0ABS0Y4N0_9HYPH|nr:hypothetical protein [Microvirga splendida]MBJ6126843.1 hypothetical protein [Microvirga splendida]